MVGVPDEARGARGQGVRRERRRGRPPTTSWQRDFRISEGRDRAVQVPARRRVRGRAAPTATGKLQRFRLRDRSSVSPPTPLRLPLMAGRSPRQLILSLYGLYARDEANWLSVRSLIALMADLGVDAAGGPLVGVAAEAARGAASRRRPTVRRATRLSGVRAERAARGRRAHLVAGPGHRSADGLADGGLLGPRGRARASGTSCGRCSPGWASAPRPPGVWVAPGTAVRRGARPRSTAPGWRRTPSCSAAPTSAPARRRDRVGEWWDLPAIAALYAEFVADHARLRG